MKNLLALDCSSDYLSLAVRRDSEIFACHELAPRQHNERLLPTIKQVLAQANIKTTDLQAIMVGRGPGSFVGVRLAMGVAQGLGFGLDIPLIPFSSMQLIAQAAPVRHERVCVALDARMNDWYLGEYQRQGDVMVPVREWVAQQDAIDFTTLDIPVLQGRQAVPDVRAAFSLLPWCEQNNLVLPAAQAQPVYLRGDKNWRRA